MSNKDFENGLALGLSVGTGYKGDNFPDDYAKINKYQTSFNFDTAVMPEEFTVDFSDSIIKSFYTAFMSSSTNASLKKIILIGSTSNATAFTNAFQRRSGLTEINGEIDYSLCTRQVDINAYSGCTALEEIRFKPNSISPTFNFSVSSHLTDESIISVANGLNASATGQTLTLHATPKARCATLMGNVNTDGLFVADSILDDSYTFEASTLSGYAFKTSLIDLIYDNDAQYSVIINNITDVLSAKTEDTNNYYFTGTYSIITIPKNGEVPQLDVTTDLVTATGEASVKLYNCSLETFITSPSYKGWTLA